MADVKHTPSPLERAISQREHDYRSALDRVRALADSAPDAAACWALREAVELAACLRRLVRGRSVAEIHAAFGAPGDFGYETLIGDALSRFYQGKP